jgi:methyl-accepting chemotaxis protein
MRRPKLTWLGWISIEEISNTIGQIAEISTAIAAAVEEQGAATQEITRGVQQAAVGATLVTGSTAKVNRGAVDTGSAAENVHGLAVSLLAQSKHLNDEIGNFLRTVRSAWIGKPRQSTASVSRQRGGKI